MVGRAHFSLPLGELHEDNNHGETICLGCGGEGRGAGTQGDLILHDQNITPSSPTPKC
jgi:hypothetical protein